jgi:1,4-dihydroxy-2-naphthoate octaprenyltransferase
VIVGTAAAGEVIWWRFAAAALVAAGLQIGVNLANDYFDGVRGVDTHERVGPPRITQSGAASPRAVLGAALLSIAVAGFAGLALAIATQPVLVLVVGGLGIIAALLYSGGPRPYAGLGLGEVMVFVFFGLVAVVGTTYVQTETWSLDAVYAAVGVGALASAILVANNLRDIPTDKRAGKRTLAVALGDERTRHLYGLLIDLAVIALIGIALTTTWWVALALVAGLPAVRAVTTVLGDKAIGTDLIPVLQQTGVAELLYAAGLFVGLTIGAVIASV